MKKFALILLLFLVTACGANQFLIDPSGTPQRLSDPEIYEEYDTDPTPVNIPIATAAPLEADSVLRLSMRHPMTLNPLLNEDITVSRILRLIFEPLIILDENLRPTSHLAEIEMMPDFSSARLAIRNDAFWHDGRPVTSDDLIFSVEKLRNAPANAIYRNNVRNIASITRINTRTVQVHFHHASPVAGLCLNFPIIPRHHYQNQTNPSSVNNMNPIGNGAFMFQSHSPMRNITLTQNSTSFRQLSQIEEIEIVFLPDTQTDLYAFDQGRIDAIYLPLTEWVRHHSVRHPRYEIFPAMYFEFIGFNFQSEIFQNLHMRRGIAYAFKADEAINAVYLNHAVRAVSPIHPNSFTAAIVQGSTYNPDRATALLNAVPLYYPLVIIANDDNFQRVSIAHRLAASINAVGISARAEILPYTEYFARLDSGDDFDMFIGGVNLAFVPDAQFFFQGGLWLEDSVLEEAFLEIQTAHTEVDYMQAVARFQQAFVENLPVIGLAFRHSAVLTNTRILQNSVPAPDNIYGWVNLWEFTTPE